METMKDIMYACIILQNMIIEDESTNENLEPLFEIGGSMEFPRELLFESLVVGTQELEKVD